MRREGPRLTFSKTGKVERKVTSKAQKKSHSFISLARRSASQRFRCYLGGGHDSKASV